MRRSRTPGTPVRRRRNRCTPPGQYRAGAHRRMWADRRHRSCSSWGGCNLPGRRRRRRYPSFRCTRACMACVRRRPRCDFTLWASGLGRDCGGGFSHCILESCSFSDRSWSSRWSYTRSTDRCFPPAKESRGLGLITMEERVKVLNGTLAIQSQPMGGTTIHARVPVNSSSDSARAAG